MHLPPQPQMKGPGGLSVSQSGKGAGGCILASAAQWRTKSISTKAGVWEGRVFAVSEGIKDPSQNHFAFRSAMD